MCTKRTKEAEIRSKLLEMQPTTHDDGGVVTGEDLMVSIVEISYGKGYSNPVDHAHFLTKDGVEFGQITSEKVGGFM